MGRRSGKILNNVQNKCLVLHKKQFCIETKSLMLYNKSSSVDKNKLMLHEKLFYSKQKKVDAAQNYFVLKKVIIFSRAARHTHI